MQFKLDKDKLLSSVTRAVTPPFSTLGLARGLYKLARPNIPSKLPSMHDVGRFTSRARVQTSVLPQRTLGRAQQAIGKYGQQAQQFFGLEQEARDYQRMRKQRYPLFSKERISRNIIPLYSARKTIPAIGSVFDTAETVLSAGLRRREGETYKQRLGDLLKTTSARTRKLQARGVPITAALPAAAISSGITKERLAEEIKSGTGFTGALQSYGVPTKYALPVGLVAGMALPGAGDIRKAKAGKELVEEGVGKLAKSDDDVIRLAKKSIAKYSEEKVPLKIKLKDVYTDWVNRFQPIEDITSTAEKKLGKEIPSKKSPRYAVTQLLGVGGRAELRHRQKFMPILNELGDIPKDDFDVFLKAKRDLELAGRGIAGSNKKEANAVIRALSKKYDVRKLDDVATQLYKYQDEGLQKLLRAGFINDDTYKKIKDVNKNYVPFQRVMDTIDNYIGVPTRKLQQATQPIKKIKGSERAVYSPLESIIANTFKIESAVAKNRVAKTIAQLGEMVPELGINKVNKAGGNTMSVWDGGKKFFYQVPEDVARAVKGLNEESMGTIMKILSAPASVLRQQATGRNIDFMIPNVFRDQLDAAIGSKYGYIPFYDYFKGLRNLVQFKKTGYNPIVEQWLNSGGSIYFGELSGRKTIRQQVLDVAKKKRLLRKIRDWAVEGIDTLGEYSEIPTRLGAFERALSKTGDPLKAAQESRDIILDFARMGAKMKTANSIIPFLNVRVQGFDKLIRIVKTNPKRAALLVTVYGGLPALTTAVYNNLFHREEYAKIPDYKKENNFVIVMGRDKNGDPSYITIPKGNIIPYVANTTEQFVTWLAHNNPQTFSQLAMSVFTEMLPVVEGGGDIKEAASRTVGGLIPQAMKPAVQQVANYDFFRGRPIVADYLKRKEPSKQFYPEYTEGVYVKLGQILNISPLRIKNFLESTFAGGAKVPVNVVQALSALQAGKPVNKDDIPILRRFLSTASGYDIKRPEKKEKKPLSARLGDVLATDNRALASDGTQLPTRPQELEVLYKDALSTLRNYPKNKFKAQYDLVGKDLEEYQQEANEALATRRAIERKYPKVVLDLEFKEYGKGGNRSVAERAKWAITKLSKSAGTKDFDTLAERMYKDGVLTDAVVDTIEKEYGKVLPYRKDMGVTNRGKSRYKKYKKTSSRTRRTGTRRRKTSVPKMKMPKTTITGRRLKKTGISFYDYLNKR